MNRDAVDVKFKVRFPSKIAFDMSARKPDNKIKNCIIL
jgi:hypothetical protein